MAFLLQLHERRNQEPFKTNILHIFRPILEAKTQILSLTSDDLGTVLTAGSARAPGWSPSASALYGGSVRSWDTGRGNSHLTYTSISSYASANSSTHKGNDLIALFKAALDLHLIPEATKLIEFSTANVASKHDVLSLNAAVTVPLIRAFMKVTAEHKEPLAIDVKRSFVEALLEGMTTPILKKRPRPPQGWSRTPRGCGCDDCVVLDQFLVSRTLQTERFTMTGQRRSHIERQLRNHNYDMETEKIKPPFTLIITKTDRDFRQQMAHWNSSTSPLRTELESLQQDSSMQELLGDRFSSLVLLERPQQGFRAPKVSQSMGNLRSSSLSNFSIMQSRPRPAEAEFPHGMKRKAASDSSNDGKINEETV